MPSLPDSDGKPLLTFKIELEMLMAPPAEPISRGLISNDEWASMVDPLRRSLDKKGLRNCTVVNHGTEPDDERWCIIRNSATSNENKDDATCYFRFVSPILRYYNIDSFDQHMGDLRIVFPVFNIHGCKLSSSNSTRFRVIPSEEAVSTFTLAQAREVAKTVQRYSGVLEQFADKIDRDCFLLGAR
ncbi:hypothetical protein FHL15_008191 [Xylaria flabelliformis]|uniref:Uncharacterized protein n=1 Tax=Xylaria flabelliformis TaxID=2512241 RepID=A0A553HSP9_9PEZI|nr:hypothetical protein FHL15_008191 [Xylaria flabelliformis]